MSLKQNKLLGLGVLIAIIGHSLIVYPVPESEMFIVRWLSAVVSTIKAHMALPFVLLTLYCFYSIDLYKLSDKKWQGNFLGYFLGIIITLVFTSSVSGMFFAYDPHLEILSGFLGFLYLPVVLFVLLGGFKLGHLYGVVIYSIIHEKS